MGECIATVHDAMVTGDWDRLRECERVAGIAAPVHHQRGLRAELQGFKTLVNSKIYVGINFNAEGKMVGDTVVENDEYIKHDATLEGAAGLRAASSLRSSAGRDGSARMAA